MVLDIRERLVKRDREALMGRRTVREISEEGTAQRRADRACSWRATCASPAGAGPASRSCSTPGSTEASCCPIFGTLDARGERVYREAHRRPAALGRQEPDRRRPRARAACTASRPTRASTTWSRPPSARRRSSSTRRSAWCSPTRCCARPREVYRDGPRDPRDRRPLPRPALGRRHDAGPPPHRLRDRRVPRAPRRLDARGDDLRHGRHEERPAASRSRPPAPSARARSGSSSRARAEGPARLPLLVRRRRRGGRPRPQGLARAPTPRSGSP